jgi:hypothetical protein
MTDDLLSTLRSRRDTIVARIAACERELAEVHAAIAAIENIRGVTPPVQPLSVSKERSKRRRGEVMKAVSDAVREGHGTVQEIRQACNAKGLELSPNSISNTLNRLRTKNEVWHDRQLDRWITFSSDREKLFRDLHESLKLEGSKAGALEPSELNGTTSPYSLAASEGPTAV